MTRKYLFVKKEGAKRPHKAIDLEYVKCQWVIDGDTNGILFIKNMEHFAIFTKKQNVYQEWKEELRSLCLISDFHDEYKVCKLVGNGSFAKVRFQKIKNFNDNPYRCIKQNEFNLHRTTLLRHSKSLTF